MENDYIEQFNTGDILLFNNDHFLSATGWFSSLIKYFTHSPWSHVGMIVKDPDFTEKKLDKGLYLWESSLEFIPDAEDNKIKLSVQIVPLKKILDKFKGVVVWRKLDSGDIKITTENLNKIHKLVHNIPYDLNPIDWIEAYLEHSPNPQKIKEYFCSALIARIYSYLKLIDSKINWSIIRPSSFSTILNEPTHINLINNAKLGPEIQIKNN